MAPVLVCLILILCLLISVVKYTLALILKWSVPKAVVKKDYTYQPTVSVLMPCFNEGKTVYETIESISKSNYPNDKFEVIAQDDCSVDDSYEWMLKAQRDFDNVKIRVGRNTVNSGKARSVCNALQNSTNLRCHGLPQPVDHREVAPRNRNRRFRISPQHSEGVPGKKFLS
jgi:cellulose synthase/poly-beta-1,6-N-acetylglucosamine synthase-like glycosyltransferase